MFELKKNKSTIDCKPKTHIKGEIGVVLGLLILGFVTVTLIIRLFGMIFYDWHERGNYFLLFNNAQVFRLLPGEQEIDKCYWCLLCDHDPDVVIIKDDTLLINGQSDRFVGRMLVGFPVKYKNEAFMVRANDVYMTVEKGAVFDFWKEYSEDEKKELISIYKSTLIKVSIIESIIIIIRLIINYKLVMLLIKKLKEYRKEDRLGIEPRW